jgi:hypothetical protein
MTNGDWIIINFLTIIANLLILGLHIKLYTEILKDKSADRRNK